MDVNTIKDMIMNRTDKAKAIIKWSELSRSLAHDRSAITRDRIPKKHEEKLNELIDFISDWMEHHQVGK